MSKYIEIEFKGCRKTIYSNPEEYPFKKYDYAIVRAEKGEDIGQVCRMCDVLPDEIDDDSVLDILRKASDRELTRLEENRIKEEKAKTTARKYIGKHKLDMKLVSVEYQLDANKVTFYFTADQRVDFRELVKDLAAEFKARIELRQIGVRDEARLLGGCGICGLQLCCTTCIRNFAPVSTQYAKDQMLSANPTKLSGNCGRLRCCLLYEQDFYNEEVQKYPGVDEVVNTEKGPAVVEKIDVFREVMHIRYQNNELEQVTLDQIKNNPDN